MSMIPESYIPISAICDEAGVSKNAVHRWIEQHAPRQKRTQGGVSYISSRMAKAYLESTYGVPRAPKRPKGWLPAKAVREMTELSHTHYIMRYVKAHSLRFVRVGRTYFMHPEDAALLARIVKDDREPLPGWVSAVDVAERKGVTSNALRRWLRRNGVKHRHYLHSGKRYVYLREADAKRYMETRA